ncbi:MAG: FHA domain-containing protein [Myxococcaceae bacterium]
MVSTQELKALVQSLDSEALVAQLGPFVLIQRPKKTNRPEDFADVTQPVHQDVISTSALALIFQFDDLLVANLPPLRDVDELFIGRLPDCDVCLDDPSVSKRHAVLRWDAKSARCSVADLGSKNGTFLNAATRLHGETTLRDGDILSFGDAQFWYLHTSTLHTKLTALKPAGPTPAV